MSFQGEMCQKCGAFFIAGTSCRACGTGKQGTSPTVASQPGPTPTSSSGASADRHENVPVPLGPIVKPAHVAGELSRIHRFTFHGSGSTLLGIHVNNVFLSLITLGVYYFWGKVRVRNYLFSQTEFYGDRFSYHGTGKELLRGFLVAVLALGLVYALFNAAPYLPGGTPVRALVIALAYGTLLVFMSFAIVASRRYKLSRTSWRGIRFSFRGSFSDFIKLYVRGAVLTVLTLGIYLPFFVVHQHRYLISHTYFGNQPFRFDGEGRELFQIYLPIFAVVLFVPVGFALSALIPPLVFIMVGYLLFVYPVVIFYSFWIRANQQRYLWAHTSCGTTQFRATMTGGGLLLLNLINTMLLLLTVGLAWPWVVIRNIEFVVEHLSIEGPLDLAAIEQDAQSATAVGEGFDALLGLDTGFAA